jgi:hypothetical protein
MMMAVFYLPSPYGRRVVVETIVNCMVLVRLIFDILIKIKNGER